MLALAHKCLPAIPVCRSFVTFYSLLLRFVQHRPDEGDWDGRMWLLMVKANQHTRMACLKVALPVSARESNLAQSLRSGEAKVDTML